MKLIRTEYLQLPRLNGTTLEAFVELYPWSIEAGETHLVSCTTYEQAANIALAMEDSSEWFEARDHLLETGGLEFFRL